MSTDGAQTHPEGLHGPRGGTPAELSASKRFTPRNIAIQLTGFALSVALLVWVISQAIEPENREAWSKLREAGPFMIAGLAGVTVGNIAINGMIFHAVARPVRRFHPAYLIAVNALATLLATLPFKLGVFIRGLIHHRRDHMSFKLIVGWFAGVGALGVVTLVPIALLGLWRSSADVLWFVGAGVTLTVSHAGAIMVSRIAARQDSIRARTAARLSLGSWRFLRFPSATLGHAAWRIGDFVMLAARFYIAAKILGFEITPEQALLLGTTFFLISVSAPSGNLGVREAATVALAKAVGIEGSIAALAILVSFAELVTALALSLPAIAIIRPGRVIRRGHHPREERAGGGEGAAA